MYTVTVTAYSLHVRKQPKYKSSPVAWIHKGETYTASKTQNGWYYIDSKKGWSNGRYLSIKKKEPKPEPPKKEPEKPKESIGDQSEVPLIPEVSKRTVYTLDDKMATSNNFVEYDVSISSAGDAMDYMERLKQMPTEEQPMARTMARTIQSASTKSQSPITIPTNPSAHITNFNKNMRAIRKNFDIYDRPTRFDNFNKFNRFKIPDPGNVLTKTVPYVFFTRPSLNLIDMKTMKLKKQFKDDPLYTHIIASNRHILDSLGESLTSTHTFNPFLSNSARSFEPQDEIIKTTQAGETYTGWKIMYGRNSIESRTAGQFNIQYQDNPDADIYKIHKVWTDYINRVYRGAWKVRRQTIEKKILNYASSLYYVVCAADGETVLYWAKYYGVFPINAPSSAMSWSHGPSPGVVDFTINYVYSMKEEFNPVTLLEFNMQSSGSTDYKPIYSKVTGTTTDTFSGAPFIEQTKDANGMRSYKLRFRNTWRG